MTRLGIAASILFIAALAACGGGGGGRSSALPGTGPATNQKASATVRILIPKANAASSSAKRPAYVSSSTATIDISTYTVNGATPSPLPTPLSVSTSSPDCSSGTSGTTCSISVSVPLATAVTLQISTLDASGNLLGTGFIGPVNTLQTPIAQQNVTLGGVPASLVFSRAGFSAGDDGTTQTIPFTVSALDADGNTIIQPGNYTTPISLAISGDTNGALSLTTTTFASPGPTNGEDDVTLTYNSSIAISQATITASAGSVHATAPFAPIVFTPTTLAFEIGGSAQTLTVSEAGYSGAFTYPSGSPLLSFVCSPSNCTPASAGGSVTITVGVLENATTSGVTFPITDSYGGTANVGFSVTGTTGGGGLVGPPYTIDSYPLPEPSAQPPAPYGIAVGPDAASLWIVDRANQTVDVIASPSACTSTSCSVAWLPGGTFGDAYYDLESIASAPGGNVYVGDAGNATTDYGNLFQLIGCSASSATCTATNAQTLPVATPAPGPMLVGPDGNLYVGSLSQNGDSDYDWGAPIMISPVIGCCDFSWGVMIWLPASSSGPSAVNGMTIDASGTNLWYTDGVTGNIGLQEIPCTEQCATVELPDGAYDSGSARGRPVHASKKIKHPYAQRRLRRATMTPPAGASLSTALNGIVSGPDGYLYVADPGQHTIDQIDPNVWDGAVSGSDELCSVAATCTYSPIALPQTNGIPLNLTVGPDGNVWFTDSTGYVGVVLLSSCSTNANGCQAYEYSVGGSPWGITAGPDGNVWFTFSTPSGSNNLGKVVL